jgi:hypothetical protein
MLGMNISEANTAIGSGEIEVSLVSKLGFWLLIDNEERFLAYADFPWFKTATIDQITFVERPSENHLYWPSLDIDLSLESIRNPNLFPLISRTQKH